MYEHQIGEKKVNICKPCRAALAHGRKKESAAAAAAAPAASAAPAPEPAEA